MNRPVDRERMLARTKMLHTIIWVPFVLAIIYVLYCSIFQVSGRMLVVAVGYLLVELAVLFFNGGKCPLTSYAEKLTDDVEPGFDIDLPEWLIKRHRYILALLFSSDSLSSWYGTSTADSSGIVQWSGLNLKGLFAIVCSPN